MTGQENTSVVISEYEQKWVEGLNTGNVSVADQVFHPDCVIHINPLFWICNPELISVGLQPNSSSSFRMKVKGRFQITNSKSFTLPI